MKRILILLLGILLSQPAFAALTSGNVTAHTHADAANGGALGAVSATSVTATGAVSATSVTATGAVSGGSIATSGTLSSTKACDAGYTRKGPNYCSRNAGAGATALVRDTCTAITLPAGATALLVEMSVQANSANAIALRSSMVGGFSGSSCNVVTLQLVAKVSVSAREEVAVASGTEIASLSGLTIISTTTPYFMFEDDAGDTGLGSYVVRGYFD